MDKLDFAILNVIQEADATTSLKAISRKQIIETIEIGSQNLFIRLKKLLEDGLVNKGLKDGREHTYFITKSGIKIFEEAMR